MPDQLNKRYSKMKAIRDELLAASSSSLFGYRTENNYFPVVGEGSHNAHIMFVGEAPGENEAKTGKPFCGAAGRIFDELLASINIQRTDVYVTNIVKDRPPANRDPLPEEIDFYAPFLDRQIDIIQPFIIATLGRFSTMYVMNRFGLAKHVTNISAMHGRSFTAAFSWGETDIVPLLHPAVALYKASMKQTLIDDFRVINSLAALKEKDSKTR